MEKMSTPETIIRANEPIRPLKRAPDDGLPDRRGVAVVAAARSGSEDDPLRSRRSRRVLDVNHVDDVVEVYRDRHAGQWRAVSRHHRGETITMAAFPDVEIAVSEVLPPR